MTNRKPAGKGDQIESKTEDSGLPEEDESQDDEEKPDPATYRIGTYNVQNFFDRVRDWSAEYLDPWSRFDTRAKPFGEVNTVARRIWKSTPHTLAIQEIESYTALRDFNLGYLFPSVDRSYTVDKDGIIKNIYYSPRSGICSIPGNDSRGIDLGALSTRQFPIGRVTSHRYTSNKQGGQVFSRDCLQVEILYDDTIGKKNSSAKSSDQLPLLLTLFICHFKSKYTGLKPDDFKDREEFDDAKNRAQVKNSIRRRAQAQAVVDIIKKFDPNNEKPYIVLGDFNDFRHSDALGPLLDTDNELCLIDAMNACATDNAKNPCKCFGGKKGKETYLATYTGDPYVPDNSQATHPTRARARPWDTHKWKANKKSGHMHTEYSQIDYILLSEPLRRQFKLVEVTVEHSGNTTGSDHYLYWAEFKFDPDDLSK